MSSYYLRIKPQLLGTNTLHKEGCPFLPDIENRIYLGKYGSSTDALKEAKRYFSKASCCLFCAKEALENKKINHDLLKDYPGLSNFDPSVCN
jgi:hypothetical protein